MKISLVENGNKKVTIGFDEARVLTDTLTISIFNKEEELICQYSYDEQNTPEKNIKKVWFIHDEFLYERYLKIEARHGSANDSLIIDQKYTNIHHLSNFYNSSELEKIKETKKIPYSLKKGSAELVFCNPLDHFKDHKPTIKPFIMSIYGHGQGDVLCAEPTIRRISEALGKKVCVITKRPEVFFNHPNIDKIFITSTKDKTFLYRSDPHNTKPNESLKLGDLFDRLELSPCTTGITYRHTAGSHLLRYAFAAGFSLREHERTIKYYPYEPEKKHKYSHLEDYVICAIYNTSSIKFWSFNKWNKLFKLLAQQGIKVAVIGFIGGNMKKNDPSRKDAFTGFFTPNHTEELDLSEVLDLTNLSLEENYHIINQSKLLITTDTGTLHLAGATDTWIVTIGGHIAPDVIMPHRHGSQKYKAFFLSGSCTKFCGSDINYSMNPNGYFKNSGNAPDFTSHAHTDSCLELFNKPYCHPVVDTVFNKVKEILQV